MASAGEHASGTPSRLARVLAMCAHVVPVLWIFGPLLTGRSVLYFRDVAFVYFPQAVFVERSLRQGIWPLWNPSSNAGAPYLLAYPLDLALLVLGGARLYMAVMPALHLLLALCGASLLALRLGASPWGAWLTGSAYGLSGFVLSTVNLVPLFQGAAWAPWVLVSFLALLDRPTPRRVALLAIVSALQVSTLAMEIAVQTALVGLVLAASGRKPTQPRRQLAALAAAAAATSLLVAPVAAGVLALVRGTTRASGFPVQSTFSFSTHPSALLEAIVPRLLGDLHSFSDWGLAGQPFLPEGYPYVLSLYLGVGTLILATWARPRRLWLLVILGVSLSLGSYGPLKQAMSPLMHWTRSPVKFFFMATLAIAIGAGLGLDRALAPRVPGAGTGTRRQNLVAGLRRWWRSALPVAGLVLFGIGLALGVDPVRAAGVVGRWLPALGDPYTMWVARTVWPSAFVTTGALLAAAGLALLLTGRWRRLAALLIVADLLIVNSAINRLCDRRLYDLRPETASLIELTRRSPSGRWFSYGTTGLEWQPEAARLGTDVWLYGVERQSLSPRFHMLDGLDDAYDLDREGWAPAKASFSPDFRHPRFFEAHYPLLRLAGVRWVLSFLPLPGDSATERGRAAFPELRSPLRLYELRDPLPRAYWVPGVLIETDPQRGLATLTSAGFDPRRTVLLATPLPHPPAASRPFSGQPRVELERPDVHTIEIEADTPAGFIVVSEQYSAAWRVRGPEGPGTPLEANGRYCALPTPGGKRSYTLRYVCPGMRPALVMAAIGLLAVTLSFFVGAVSPGSWRRTPN